MKIERKSVFFITYIILITEVFLKYLVGVGLPAEIILLTYCISAICADKTGLVTLLGLSIPLNSSFQYLYGLTFVTLLYVIKYTSIRKTSIIVFCPFFLTLLEIYHVINNSGSMFWALKILIPVYACVILLTDDRIADVDFSKTIRYIGFTTAIMCIIVLKNSIGTNGFSAFVLGGQRLSISNAEVDSMGANFNANFLGYLCLFSALFLFLFISKRNISKAYSGLVVILLFFGVLTMSRTYLLCLAISCILYLISQKNLKLIKTFLLYIVIGVLVSFILSRFFPSIIEAVNKRFLVQDISSGRNDLFSIYNEMFLKNLDIFIFGVGTSNLAEAISSLSLINYPHNGIQDTIFAWGIIGLVLVIAIIVYGIKKMKMKRNTSVTLLSLIPLLVYAIRIQAGQFVTFAPNIIMLAFCILFIFFEDKEGLE